MSKFINVIVPFNYSKKNEDCANLKEGYNSVIHASCELTLLFDVEECAFYKPLNVKVKKGSKLTLYFQKDTPGGNERMRESKSIIIKEKCSIKNNSAIVKEDFNVNEVVNCTGLVAFYGVICGSNQNRKNSAYIESKYEHINNINIAEMFQQPKKTKDEIEIIDTEYLDELYDTNEDVSYVIDKLIDYQLHNIETCSVSKYETPKITSNKNGQQIYDISDIGDLSKIINKENALQQKQKITSIFRRRVQKFRGERCLLCGINKPSVMVASHIKAKRHCKDTQEMLDENNGFWLCANHDKVFDRNLISFDKHGKILVSNDVMEHLDDFNIDLDFELPKDILSKSNHYLDFHRDRFNKINK